MKVMRANYPKELSLMRKGHYKWLIINQMKFYSRMMFNGFYDMMLVFPFEVTPDQRTHEASGSRGSSNNSEDFQLFVTQGFCLWWNRDEYVEHQHPQCWRWPQLHSEMYQVDQDILQASAIIMREKQKYFLSFWNHFKCESSSQVGHSSIQRK